MMPWAALWQKRRTKAAFNFGPSIAEKALRYVPLGRKLIASCRPASGEVGEVDEVYELESDPTERRNLLADPPAWLSPLEKRLRPMAGALLLPLYSPELQQLTVEQMEALRMMGYTDF